MHVAVDCGCSLLILSHMQNLVLFQNQSCRHKEADPSTVPCMQHTAPSTQLPSGQPLDRKNREDRVSRKELGVGSQGNAFQFLGPAYVRKPRWTLGL